MTDPRTSASEAGGTDIDPRLDPAPVFGDSQPTVHPGHPVLRRALDHAPDRGSEPDDELRQAIRSFAHESVAPSLPSGRAGLLGRRAGEGATGLEARTRARRSRLLRNLIVAAVLVAIVATVTWHREPGPGNARPAATAPEAAVQPVAPTTPAASAPAAVAMADPPASASASAGAPALSEAEKILFAPRVTLPESASPAASAAAKAPKVATPSMPATATTPAPPSATPSATPTPPAAQPKTNVAALPATPAPATGTLPGAASERAKATAASAAATAMPATPASSAATPTGRAAASFAAPGGTTAAPGSPAVTSSATAAKPAAEAAPPAPPTFAALSQWNQMTMTRADGTTRRRSKADVRELGALLGSAALAGGGAEPIKGRVDWRVSLERNGQTIARVELAGNQVRWIENNAAPGTGTPPPGSLDSVREMLENVFEEPAPSPAPVPAEVQNR